MSPIANLSGRAGFAADQPLPEAAAELLAALVSIDSVNPDLVPGGAGEGEIAAFIAGWLEAAGLEVTLVEAAPGRPSVVGRAAGSGGGRSLMLNGHIDTVGVDGMADPFVPRIEDGRLYGRGAYDMKGGVASVMLAAAHAQQRDLRGDVVVTAVCDEEYASIGCQSVLERYTADACIVTEPTSLRVCVAHKGFVWATIETEGRAAHGSRPDLGRDAIGRMGHVLTALRELEQHLGERKHRLLGPGSVHASLISGGQELSSYPASCSLGIERRTLPGETEDDVRREIEELAAAVRRADPEAEATYRIELVREPFEVAEDAEIVRTLAAEVAEVVGEEQPVIGDHPWMDAAFTSAAGIPTVVFGPGGAGAHAHVEYGDVASVASCAEAMLRTAERFCA